MNNQRGNITLFSCLFILMISCWSMVYLQRQASNFKSLKKKIFAYKCVKDLNGSSRNHVYKMEGLNRKLVYAKAAVILPNPALSKAALIAVKALKVAMEYRHASFLKKLFDLASQGCLFNPGTYKTPYKNKGVLTRDKLGRAILRRNKWSSTLINTKVVIKSKFKNSGGEVKIKTQSWELPEDLL